VAAADTLSAARPGARSETMETYVKRIGQLEEIAKGFDGVQQAYAMQAGREIRVMVIPDKVSDADAVKMAQEMREKIESTMTYPGRSRFPSSANIAALRPRSIRREDVRILFYGDIVGKVGRLAVHLSLPRLVKKYDVDFVIANGENASHGKGLTESHYRYLVDSGVDCITLGNHWHSKARNRRLHR
jgi:hypothetical protein